MAEELNFLDELLLEVEAKEQKLQLAHVDMVLKEISDLNSDISRIFTQAEEERRIITEWAISRTAKLNDRVDWLTQKLQAFMDTEYPAARTVDLAHGQLLRRKQVGKLVVENLEEFMKNNNLSELTSISPEVIRPDLAKIKAFYKMSRKIPLGTTLIESTDKFSIKLKDGGKCGTTSKDGTGSEQTDEDSLAA